MHQSLRVELYISRLCAGRAAVVWATASAALILSQWLRLGHRLAGAQVGAGELVELLAMALAPAAVAMAPVAVGIATAWTLMELRARGEVDALRTAGCSRGAISLGPVAVALCVGLLAEGMLVAAPTVGSALAERVAALMARAIVARAERGTGESWGDVVFLTRGDAALMRRGAVTWAATRHTLKVDGTNIEVVLEAGEMLVSDARIPIDQWSTRIDLREGIDSHVRFLTRQMTSAPLWSPALALGGACVALVGSEGMWLGRIVALCALLLAYAAGAGAEGAALLAVLCTGFLAWVSRRGTSRRGTSSPRRPDAAKDAGS